MKTKVILIALATIAALSISASKLTSPHKATTKPASTYSAPIGGLVTDDK